MQIYTSELIDSSDRVSEENTTADTTTKELVSGDIINLDSLIDADGINIDALFHSILKINLQGPSHHMRCESLFL